MKFQKSVLASGIALALVSGAASAANLTTPNRVFIGGATAPQNFMLADYIARVCDPAQPITAFTDSVKGILASGVLTTGDQWTLDCTAQAGLGGAIGGQPIAIYKYNGGSATGVAPVQAPLAADPADMAFLDAHIPGCALHAAGVPTLHTPASTYDVYECTNPALIKTQHPDAGVSDVEPSIFVGNLALNFGTEPRGVSAKADQPYVDLGNLSTKGGPGLVFGVAVTVPMYDELLDDQVAAGLLPGCNGGVVPAGRATPNSKDATRDTIACMPSLPSQVIRSVFAGQVSDWSTIAPYGLPLNPVAGPNAVPEGNNVHFCKRTNGSGTHAQVSLEYLGTNCTSTSNVAMLEQTDGLSAAFAGLIGVYANSGSSDMADCLNALGNGAGFNGDFAGLPPESFPGTGDSTVVPGTSLPAIAIPGDPRGYFYNTPVQAYAMGYNSTENNTDLADAYRFVKVDWAAPTLEDAISGEYAETYYLSFQHRTADAELSPTGSNPRPGAAIDLHAADEAATRLAGDAAAQATYVAENTIRPTVTANEVAVATDFVGLYANTLAAAIDAVNTGFVVDPNGIPGDADDWQGGFVTSIKGAAQAYTPITLGGNGPETPWARQTGGGTPDSCQTQGLVR